ncbi:MAG: ribonuclease P protein component [Micrococcales bacterium]|nr:ribonuclease P protein component [Micrococcales bacterium]
MLPRHNRIRSSTDFTHVRKTGTRGTSGRITAVVAPGTGFSRVGLVVGKQVGNSVQRKRVSRVLRHAIARALPSYPEGSQVVLRALPGAADRDSNLAVDADKAVRKALDRQ